MKPHSFFRDAFKVLTEDFLTNSHLVHTDTWQGVNISKKPEMATHELLNASFSVVVGSRRLEILQAAIQPNLPWADDHFQERVCGEPINPGVQWANWPYGKSASTFLTEGKFNHNYMERYWPKFAGIITEPTETPFDYRRSLNESGFTKEDCCRGIYHEYGDLNDIVNLIGRDPLTRQAYLPIFFPEDTGAVHGERVPCTLGYHFIVRNEELHLVYYLRSCDFIRHFRDDVYLSVRLQLWVLEQLRERFGERWLRVIPGTFTMHMTSLHCFRNDFANLKAASEREAHSRLP